MTVVRIVARTVCNVAVYGLLLFAPAGTLHWWRAWALLAIILFMMCITRLSILRGKEDLLEERRKPPFQPGQPLADKILVVGFITIVPAFIVFVPLDVFRFHLFPLTGPLLSSLGLVAVVAGATLIALALRENAFAAAIVKYQVERQQQVVDTAVYAWVRHPFYSGACLVVIGMALWLQSYAAAMLSFLPIMLLVVRIYVEERFLLDRLAGYQAYRKRVPKRLVPFIW